jgi:hypothetical protein
LAWQIPWSLFFLNYFNGSAAKDEALWHRTAYAQEKMLSTTIEPFAIPVMPKNAECIEPNYQQHSPRDLLIIARFRSLGTPHAVQESVGLSVAH